MSLLAALAGLLEVDDIDAIVPLAGATYALQFLSDQSKADEAALRACLALMREGISQAGSDLQRLQVLKRYLQQISICVIEHMIPRVTASSFRDWSQAEEVSQAVLQSFHSLMEEGETELSTSATVMALLQDSLPPLDEELGWDIPLVSCLATAVSSTSQLGVVVAALVSQLLKERFSKSSKCALRMLEDSFRRVLSTLRREEPQTSHAQVFVALVLGRELVSHSVDVVEAVVGDDSLEERLSNFLPLLVELMEMKLGGAADRGTFLCSSGGRNLRVDRLPTAFASLFVVAATAKRETTTYKHSCEAFVGGSCHDTARSGLASPASTLQGRG